MRPVPLAASLRLLLASAGCIDVECREGACEPAAATCGNGEVEAGEACDDGAANGTAASRCTAACATARCGDGVLQADEACDDGDANGPTGACTARCTVPACGDGLVEGGEACDLGGLSWDGSDRCTGSCTAPSCGDGLVSEREACDGGPGCDASCRLAGCGAARIAAGWHQTFAIRWDGTLVAGGGNEVGELGLGRTGAPERLPVEVPGEPLVRISVGATHGAGITAGGRLVTWGDNRLGQLGAGDAAPHEGRVAVLEGQRFVEVSVERDFTLALEDDGTLWGFGLNDFGQLGIRGQATCDFGGTAVPCVPAPRRIAEERRFLAAYAGRDFAVAVADDGTVLGWGENRHGPLGAAAGGEVCSADPDPHRCVRDPVPIEGVPRIRQLAPGGESTLFLDVDGVLWWVGMVPDGSGGTTVVPSPERVPPPPGEAGLRYASVAAGEFHAVAIDLHGRAFSFGANGEGQLGRGPDTSWLMPGLVPLPPGRTAVEAAASWRHTALRLDDGSVLVMGQNSSLSLGVAEENVHVTEPTPYPLCP